MKKLILIISLLSCFILLWCSSQKEFSIEKPTEYNISKKSTYSLDCKTVKYTSITIWWEMIDKSYITVNDWHERDTLYVESNIAKFFWSEFNVIQDDDQSLIIMRRYDPSWLTETVTINKGTWIGFDTKTLSSWITWWPNTDTYLLSCSQI